MDGNVIGSVGASVQSWAKANPRDVLKETLERHPTESSENIFRIVKEIILAEDELVESVIEYWFSNNYRSLREMMVPVEQRRKRHSKRAAAVESFASQIKKKATEMVFLDWVLPNGKPLRHCTGRECLEAGGWLQNIGKTIKRDELVGKVLSEAQVRKLAGFKF